MSESNRGGQPGNQNARTGSLVRGAIRRVLSENEAKGRESLVNIVRNLVDKAELEGDLPATRELFDRLDGKAGQSVELTGADGGPIETVSRVERVVVDANPTDSNG
jgi:hypothetical protein